MQWKLLLNMICIVIWRLSLLDEATLEQCKLEVPHCCIIAKMLSHCDYTSEQLHVGLLYYLLCRSLATVVDRILLQAQ